jgi:tetratricopeptide (TPR) repeat protein
MRRCPHVSCSDGQCLTDGAFRARAQCLAKGVERGADSAAGWKALAELQYANREYKAAKETATAALHWSVRRRQAGHETLTQFALAVRLVLARCLRRLGQLDEAEVAFKVLAGASSLPARLQARLAVGVGVQSSRASAVWDGAIEDAASLPRRWTAAMSWCWFCAVAVELM